MDSGKLRKRIYEIIEVADPDDKVSQLYDIFMIVMIVLSLIPLAFKQENILLYTMDAVAVTVFIIDYVLRFATADYKLKDHSAKAFIRYPFTAMAIIDLVSILPSLIPLNSGLRALRVIRLIRSLRVFRALRMFRYSKNFRIIANVLRESRHAMYAVCTLAIGYIFISALIMFNVEPDLFDTFLDAVVLGDHHAGHRGIRRYRTGDGHRQDHYDPVRLCGICHRGAAGRRYHRGIQ